MMDRVSNSGRDSAGTDKPLCRVCGYRFENWYPWGEDGRTPSFAICPSCGVEFGYGDSSLSAIRTWRQRWISSGAKWSDPQTPHDGLDLESRLECVPLEFK